MIFIPFIFYRDSSPAEVSYSFREDETYEEWVENEKWLLRHLIPSVPEEEINKINWNHSTIKDFKREYQDFNEWL